MFKLVLEKAEEPEVRLPTSAGSSKKQESSQKNIYFCFIDYAKHLTMWITTICGKFLEMGISDHLTCLLRNLYASQEATVRTGCGTKHWLQIRERSKSRASLVAQRVERLPAMWKTRVQSLGREDPSEKEMATYSNILAWRIPWT